MSGIPRPIVQTERACVLCGTALVITFDALNRPRHRCPTCHGTVTTPIDAGTVERVATPTPALAKLAPSRQQLQRLVLTARPVFAPGVSRPAAAARHCDRCGTPLPRQHGRGRPRVRCADRDACAGRTRGAA